jgi:uncharacterized Zn-binding protein involved in type VI secretion
MPPAARIADPTTHGAPLAPGPGSTNVMIGGQPAWRATLDQHACPAVSISGADGVGSVILGSPTVLINGQMACRQGDIVVEKPGLAMGPVNPILLGCLTVMIGDAGTPSGGLLPPRAAPTAAELQTNPVVQAAMAQAWHDSQPGDSANRHEEGGWIYMNTNTGQVQILRAPAGARAGLNLGGPPTVPGAVVVGTFHTHPNPTAEGWMPGPSGTDQNSSANSGVPWLIRADDGVHNTGPASRRGGLGGGPGFPP